MKQLTFVLLAMLLILGACGGNKEKAEEENFPFFGQWVTSPSALFLEITKDKISYFDFDDMNPVDMSVNYTRETPDKIVFEYEGKPGSAEYNRKDQTVTLKIAGAEVDGSDLEIVFTKNDRLDLLALRDKSFQKIFSVDKEKQLIDSLVAGQALKWVTDTMGYHVVKLPDGREGMLAAFVNLVPIHSVPTEDMYSYSYSLDKQYEYTESYMLEKHGDKVLVTYNKLPADGSMAWEQYYVGDIDGPFINVTKSLTDYMAATEGDFSSAEPLEEPFTILVLDANPNQYKPAIVVNGKCYQLQKF